MFAGSARPLLMGVVNATPDSFSDGGECFDARAAVARGRALAAAGADIVDVGGESTRPGARPVGEEEERRRVLPVIEALAGEGVAVSVDTRRAGVLRAALAAGAVVANDVSALSDPETLDLVAGAGAGAVLVHMRGEPRTMQRAPRYRDVVEEVHAFLAKRVAAARAAGIPAERLAVDPGFGFGKTLEHNLELMRNLGRFASLGCTVAIGVSRKSSLGEISGEGEPRARLPESLAALLFALERGAGLLRVHDVDESRRAVAVWRALARAEAA